MRVFGTFKNANRVLKDNNFSVVIDGIQLELKKDLGGDLCKGIDIFLDFDEADYGDDGNLRTFRLKGASIMVDGNETEINDNSRLSYEIVRNSKLTEIIVQGTYEEDMKDLKVLGSLNFLMGGKEVHLKSNKVKFY